MPNIRSPGYKAILQISKTGIEQFEKVFETIDSHHTIDLDDQFADTEESASKYSGIHVRYRKIILNDS